MATSEDYPLLSAATERTYIIDFYMLAPMMAMLTIIVSTVLMKNRKAFQAESDNNPYTKYVWRCAQTACILNLCREFTKIFFCSDLIVPWDYTSSLNQFISVTDSVVLTLYIFIKLLFYFGFTYHFQSILYAHDETSKLSFCLKLTMSLVAIWMFVVGLLIMIMDSTTYSAEEIGVSQHYDIYFTMVWSPSNPATAPLSGLAILIDIGYFFILFYVYISKARKTRNGEHKAMRGLLLAVSSCVFFWIFLVSLLFSSPFAPIAGQFDVTADILCLFALFDSGSLIYDNLCGCSCAKLFASGTYRALANRNGNDDEMDEMVPDHEAAV